MGRDSLSDSIHVHAATEKRLAARKLLVISLVLLALMAMALPFDVPIARWVRAHGLPKEPAKIVQLAEVFAQAYGVASILTAVCVIDVGRRRQMPRAICCAAAAGVVALLGKQVIARTRPHQAILEGGVWQTFGRFLPAISDERDLFRYASQSFPSGHAATAVGLAIGLSFLYPRGRYLFALLATLAAIQRITSAAHYLSDTLAGAAIACLIGATLLNPRRLGVWFERWENPGVREDLPILHDEAA